MSAEPQFQVVRNIDELRSLKNEWNDLLAVNSTDSVFLRHEWLCNWWDVFGGDFSLNLLLVRASDGSLMGAAPLMIGRGPGRIRGRLKHLMFIGQQGQTLSEHLDLLVRPNARDEVVRALVEGMLQLSPDWDVLYLERVPVASENIAALERCLAEAGWSAERVGFQASPYLPLAGSFVDLIGGKSKNFKRQWKNSVNRLARQGEVKLLVAGQDVSHEKAFDRMVELHRMRWGPDEGSFRTADYIKFHRRFSAALADAGDLALVLLEVGGETVAARYDFVHGGKVWCFQGGWLPEVEKMRAGTVLTGRVLEWAIERGLGEYDFLSGEDSYKWRWATAERTLMDLEAFSDRPASRLYQSIRKLKVVPPKLCFCHNQWVCDPQTISISERHGQRMRIIGL